MGHCRFCFALDDRRKVKFQERTQSRPVIGVSLDLRSYHGATFNTNSTFLQRGAPTSCFRHFAVDVEGKRPRESQRLETLVCEESAGCRSQEPDAHRHRKGSFHNRRDGEIRQQTCAG